MSDFLYRTIRFWLPLIGVAVVGCGPDDASIRARMATDSAAPAFVAAADTAPVAASSPASEPEAWLLAFVDVETTGLVPGWHEMIDLGVVMTDLDGRALNSQFDAAFLDHLFRGEGASWRVLYHYFVLDIPSMAWALGYRELTGAALADRLGVEDEPHVADEHTGITGARLNARLYRALRARGMDAPVAATPADSPAAQD